MFSMIFFIEFLFSYLPVYLWKQSVRRAEGDLFLEMLQLLANKLNTRVATDNQVVIVCRVNFGKTNIR